MRLSDQPSSRICSSVAGADAGHVEEQLHADDWRCTPLALFPVKPDRAAPGAPDSNPMVPPSFGVTFSVCSIETVTSAPESFVASAIVGLLPTAFENAMSAVGGRASLIACWPVDAELLAQHVALGVEHRGELRRVALEEHVGVGRRDLPGGHDEALELGRDEGRADRCGCDLGHVGVGRERHRVGDLVVVARRRLLRARAPSARPSGRRLFFAMVSTVRRRPAGDLLRERQGERGRRDRGRSGMIGQRAADLVVRLASGQRRSGEPLGDRGRVERGVGLGRGHRDAAHDALHLRHGDGGLHRGFVGRRLLRRSRRSGLGGRRASTARPGRSSASSPPSRR